MALLANTRVVAFDDQQGFPAAGWFDDPAADGTGNAQITFRTNLGQASAQRLVVLRVVRNIRLG